LFSGFVHHLGPPAFYIDETIPDIFLLCDNGSGNKFYQIWVNNKDAGFSLAKSGSLPSGVQTISFADIGRFAHAFAIFLNEYIYVSVDRDGTMDMVFTTCSSVSSSTGVGTDCSINIAYNKQLQLCTSSTVLDTKRKCRPPDQLCSADPNFSFDFTDSSDNNVSNICYCNQIAR
jgi:integrin alpha FG-GAP repeat containing protein 1